MKIHATLCIDHLVYAKAKERIGNLSAYVEAILRQAITKETDETTKTRTNQSLKEQLAATEAKNTELKLELRKRKEAATKRQTTSKWVGRD